jgi:hypothetical protein
MKYLKNFNESTWWMSNDTRMEAMEIRDKYFSNKSDNMDDYCGKTMFILSEEWKSLDCKVFSDKNVAGYGLGLRGRFFINNDMGKNDFKNALSKIGDSLKYKLYEIDEIDILIKDLGYDSLSKPEQTKSILEKIEKTRSSYVSVNPEKEKEMGLYVELDDLKYIITEFLYK